MQNQLTLRVDQLVKAEKIGEGTYGVVYKAKDRVTGKFYAMKKIRIDQNEEGMQSTSLREIALLKELRHPYIVELLHIEMSAGRLHLVFEFIESDLKAWLTRHKAANGTDISPAIAKRIIWQLCNGVEYMHARRVIHRDLKPSNILIDPSKHLVKICDFGLARVVGVPLRVYTHEIVTLWYRAPEILLDTSKYGYGVDVWSIACIMAELVSGRPLFQGDCEIDQIYKIFRVLGTPTPQDWPGIENMQYYKPNFPVWRNNLRQAVRRLDDGAFDFLQQMVIYDPAKRAVLKRQLTHTYFDDVDLSGLPLDQIIEPWDLRLQPLPPHAQLANLQD